MCGITGVFHYNSVREVDRDGLMAMRDTLRHRGPDADGIYVSRDRKVGLASTRLSIQDLSNAGDQPFVDRVARVSVVFNGELYNADMLRAQLRSRGVDFSSSSDTEVLLKSYLEYGAGLLARLDGIFAFAILDERRGELLLARDSLGVKPLYYLDRDGVFAFASEVKALLKLPGLPRRLNASMVASYLTFACCPGPQTLFADIVKLAPAMSLTVAMAEPVRLRRYWQPVDADRIEASARLSEVECIERVRSGLTQAVRKQMVGDVAATCSLSGGVDSSTVAALMSRSCVEPLTFFTIGFGEEWSHYNEFAYARDVARHARAELVELCVTPGQVAEFLQTSYAAICDDPNADPVCSLAYFLAREMRQHGFKVALSGEGADEIFIGYDRYLHELSAWEARLREPQSPLQPEYWGLAIAFQAQDLPGILDPDFARVHLEASRHAEPILRAHREALSCLDREDLVRRLSFIELQIRLPEILLMRVDKMSMANSVEFRVPLLDRNLVELAFALPAAWKLKGGRTKSILKSAVEGIIPAGNIQRKKMGFALPVPEWLKDAHVAPLFLDLLRQSRMLKSGIVRPDAVLRLIDEHRRGEVDRHFQLWTLLTFSLWYDRWAG
jgi:asparagine synthase (glutamine-hydrolysing)